MHRNRVRRFLCVGALSAAFLLLIFPRAGWSQKNERVTLKFSWLFTADVAPIFLGMEKGWFAAEGIDWTSRTAGARSKTSRPLRPRRFSSGCRPGPAIHALRGQGNRLGHGEFRQGRGQLL